MLYIRLRTWGVKAKNGRRKKDENQEANQKSGSREEEHAPHRNNLDSDFNSRRAFYIRRRLCAFFYRWDIGSSPQVREGKKE